MKTQHISAILLSFCLPLSLAACQTTPTEPQRNIVETFGYRTPPSMASRIADVNIPEAVTELSSQIVICTVDSMDEMQFTDIGLWNFTYSVTVEEILMDTHELLTIGDQIHMTSGEGIVKAADAAEIVRDTERARKFGILQDTYGEDDYIVSSTWDAIPIEVGKTYLVYLTDEYLANEGVFAEDGYSYLYEIDGGEIRYGMDALTDSRTAEELVTSVEEQIANRTGRADEVGASQYMQELGEAQAAEALREQTE